MAFPERHPSPTLKDQPFYLPPCTLTEKTAWVEKVFERQDILCPVPKKIQTQAIDYMRRHLENAKNEETAKMIVRKIHHTYEVVEAAQQIMDDTPDVDWDQPLSLTAAFLHDMGRFPQAGLGSFSDIKTGFDHGTKGGMIIQTYFDFEDTDVDKNRVAKIVEQHNKATPTHDDPNVFLIRDADKKALFEKVVTTRSFVSLAEQTETFAISKHVHDAFMLAQPVNNNDLKTKADEIIRMLAWLYGIHFDATKRLLANANLPIKLIEQLRQITGRDHPEIETKVRSWIEEYAN